MDPAEAAFRREVRTRVDGLPEEERLAAHLALQSFNDRARRLREIADLVVQRNA